MQKKFLFSIIPLFFLVLSYTHANPITKLNITLSQKHLILPKKNNLLNASIAKQQQYKNTITLIHNKHSLLPLKQLDTLSIACINFGGNNSSNPFQVMLTKYAPIHNLFIDKNPSKKQLNKLLKELANYNCIIIYNANANNNRANEFGYRKELTNLITLLENKRIIFCHPATPYGMTQYTNLSIDAILLSYEDHPYAQQYAAQAIFGGIDIIGKLTIGINQQYPTGTSIKTKKTRLGYLVPEMCNISSTALTKIDSICETAICTQATPGCQVLVAKDGYIIYNKAFGYNTYEKKISNNTSNIYDLASITKIAATLPAIMNLYDKKRLKLDTPLANYYTPLKKTNKKNLTIKEILYHNAGLKASIPFLANAIDKKSLTGPLYTTKQTPNNPIKLTDKLYATPNFCFKEGTISNTPKPNYDSIAPGLYASQDYQDTIMNYILKSELSKKKTYAYSDLGFILLKYAIEEITQEKMDQFCQNTFYKKLGASNTGFPAKQKLNTKNIIPSSIDNLYRKTEIRGSVHDPSAAILGGIAGHAGLFSTAEDLAKIMALYLNKGYYGGEQFFSPETVATFTQRNKTLPQNRRALGFDKPETNIKKSSPTCPEAPASSYGHTGFTGTMAWCDPVNNMIYIFLSNRTYPNEFNTKLSEQNYRTKIQEIIYEAIKK